MLMLSQPRSVSDGIEVATELFSTDASSVRAFSDSSTGGARELETREKLLESMLVQVLSALKKSGSKKSEGNSDEKHDSKGTSTCWKCGEQGYVRRFLQEAKEQRCYIEFQLYSVEC